MKPKDLIPNEKDHYRHKERTDAEAPKYTIGAVSDNHVWLFDGKKTVKYPIELFCENFIKIK